MNQRQQNPNAKALCAFGQALVDIPFLEVREMLVRCKEEYGKGRAETGHHDPWTVGRLSGKAVELGFVTSISPNTIHELLKKRTQALAARTLVPAVSGRGRG
jgi:hypothetical protein